MGIATRGRGAQIYQDAVKSGTSRVRDGVGGGAGGTPRTSK